MNIITRWFARRRAVTAAPAGRLHDFTKHAWGHAIGSMTLNLETHNWSLVGHGTGIKFNDKLMVGMKGGRIGLFLVLKVKYFDDPADMWSLTAKFEGFIS